MIVKSLSRKEPSFSGLIAYMGRGIEAGEGIPLVFQNLYGHEKTPLRELQQEFVHNAQYLPARKNGNALYHEIISIARGHALDSGELCQRLSDIATRYTQARAPRQLAYGVAHLDTDYAHIHLLISANGVGSPKRERLPKADFSRIQKELEAYVLTRYPELAQTAVYGRPRVLDRPHRTESEQALETRTGKLSHKQDVAQQLAVIFETVTTTQDLETQLSNAGFTVYQRGKTMGVQELSGKGLRHRLSTLGLAEQYTKVQERIAEKEREALANSPAGRKAALERFAQVRDQAHEQQRPAGRELGRGDPQERKPP